nr:MAG TPA: hypothetical protein [Caudoviricetes sp.]
MSAPVNSSGCFKENSFAIFPLASLTNRSS